MSGPNEHQQRADHYQHLYEQASEGKCGYSGLTIGACKASICDCFEFPWVTPAPEEHPDPAPPMSGPNERDEIAAVLAGHWAAGMAPSGSPHQWECACGEPLEMSDEAHVQHTADALTDLLAERDRRTAVTAVREALGSDEEPDMLRAMLLDASDRLANPRHRGNEHAWPKHAAMFRHLADRIERGE